MDRGCWEWDLKFIKLKKVNKLKGPSEDASIPLEREKKAITRGVRAGNVGALRASRMNVNRQPQEVGGPSRMYQRPGR